MLRRADGFVRYAVSCQYHGSSFLGFSYQRNQEDCILPDGTDLRGYRSVEGNIRNALLKFLDGDSRFENIQVSSRTDRGVHALKNTFHVDIVRQVSNKDEETEFCTKLQRGLNFYLSRQKHNWDSAPCDRSLAKTGKNFTVRILNTVPAPDFMKNDYHQDHSEQPPVVDWNARYSATQRTYLYRILFLLGGQEWGIPFEFDRCWSVRLNHRQPDVAGMQQAAGYLEGTNDFSSFRAAHCQRVSPIVTMNEVSVHARPYGNYSALLCSGFDRNLPGMNSSSNSLFPNDAAMLVTIKIAGDSFVYHQVRNMVGCLVEVGRGKLPPSQVEEILKSKDRTIAPCMAPAHGLFLVDVKHGDFLF